MKTLALQIDRHQRQRKEIFDGAKHDKRIKEYWKGNLIGASLLVQNWFRVSEEGLKIHL